MQRGDNEDPHIYPPWRWEATSFSSGGGGAGAPFSSESQTSSFYVGSSADTFSESIRSSRSSSVRPPGYDNHWEYPVIKTDEDRQSYLNYYCGMIARDGRPISIGRCVGYRLHANRLRPNWTIPQARTVSDNLLAMQLKRIKELRTIVQDTKDKLVVRHVRLDSQLYLPYVPPERRSTAAVPIRSGFNALSYDMWKRRHGNHFLGIAVHSLSTDFEKLTPRLAFFREFQHRHLGENVACAVDTFHAEMGIDASYFEAAVLDGGGDVQKGARVANNRPAQIHKCSVHTEQRVIIQGVSKTKVTLETLLPQPSRITVLPIQRLLRRGNKLVRLCKNGTR